MIKCLSKHFRSKKKKKNGGTNVYEVKIYYVNISVAIISIWKDNDSHDIFGCLYGTERN